MESTRVVNLNKEPYDVYIGRGSKWGNPFYIGKDGDRGTVIQKYEEHVRTSTILMRALPTLKGKTLGCFCKPKQCHGDILLKLLNEMEETNESIK